MDGKFLSKPVQKGERRGSLLAKHERVQRVRCVDKMTTRIKSKDLAFQQDFPAGSADRAEGEGLMRG